MTKPWIKPDWIAPANVHAATTLRVGGVSQAPYASLNPAIHVADDAADVTENRRKITTMLKLPGEPKWLQQVHGNAVVECNHNHQNLIADASYTQRSGIVCAILTADCLPILICNTNGTQIAAVHAGWRGLLAGIIENTVAKFQQQTLLAWLGPAIGPNCFEVDGDVRNGFIDKSPVFAAAFSAQDNGKWMADIYQLARIILKRLDNIDIFGGEFCTMTDSTRFYSYRRDGQTGRMATLIWKD
jgi:YfiH family protein